MQPHDRKIVNVSTGYGHEPAKLEEIHLGYSVHLLHLYVQAHYGNDTIHVLMSKTSSPLGIS